jgi:hypothetical protein
LVKWGDFQAKLPTEADVRLWWSKWPEANIGLATGALSGTFVLDADSPEAIQYCSDMGGLEDAPVHLTGKGRHFLFAHPGYVVRNFAGKFRPNIDARADGGYILLAPSLHVSGKRYQWLSGEPPDFKSLPSMPDWLLSAMKTPTVERVDGTLEWNGERLDVVQFEEGVPEGRRNDQLFRLACSLRGKGLAQEIAKLTVLAAAARCQPPLDEAEAVQLVERAWQRYPAPPPSVDAVARGLEEDEDGEEDAPPEGEGAPMPFPVDALPEVVARFVREAAADIVTPPEYIAVPFLVSVGATIGGRLEIAVKRKWKEGPNLFAACVGKPGSKKSPSMSAALLPFMRLTKRLAREHQAAVERWRADYAAWKHDKDAGGPEPPKPPYPHRWTADATVEALVPMLTGAPGILLQMDELSAWVAGMDQYKNGKGADRDHYLSLWSRSAIKVDRRGHLDEPIVVERPTLSVVGGIQPDRLHLLANAAGDDGFLARLLLSWPDPMPNGVFNEDEVSDEATEAVCALFELLHGLRYDPGDYDEQLAYEVRFDDEAKQRWRDWFAEHGVETDAVADVLNGAWAKMPAQLLRLTLILHAIDTVRQVKPPVGLVPAEGMHIVTAVDSRVSLRTLESAIALIEYFKAQARRVYRLLGERWPEARGVRDVPSTPRDLRREKILRALRVAGRMTQSKIQREVFKRNISAEELDELLAATEADGEIEREVESLGARTITSWKLARRPTAEAA